MKSGMSPSWTGSGLGSRTCALVKAFLKAGVMTADGDRKESYTARLRRDTLPLLANIALSALDDHFARQWQTQMGTEYQRKKRRKNSEGTRRIARYADDFVIMVNGTRAHAEALQEETAAVLGAWMRRHQACARWFHQRAA